jgi:iron complex transport system ATP-binding protein
VLLSATAEAAARAAGIKGWSRVDQARERARAYVELDGVGVWAPDRSDLLREVTWRVRPGEHWALLGPNGAGKTTLLSMAGARRHPSAGAVRVLGQRLGKVDMRELRRLIGVVDQALRMPDELTAEAVVLTGASGSIQPLWDRYGAAERARASELLELMGCAHLAARRVGTCSQGERGRVRIARALMPSPRLLLLDEPASGLDLAARELLLGALAELVYFEPDLATVVVSHHLEDLPPHTTHALLLAGGQVVAAGQVDVALTGEAVSACFGLGVEVRRHDGRWLATMTDGAACLAGPSRHMVG